MGYRQTTDRQIDHISYPKLTKRSANNLKRRLMFKPMYTAGLYKLCTHSIPAQPIFARKFIEQCTVVHIHDARKMLEVGLYVYRPTQLALQVGLAYFI